MPSGEEEKDRPKTLRELARRMRSADIRSHWELLQRTQTITITQSQQEKDILRGLKPIPGLEGEALRESLRDNYMHPDVP
jgi:hypothetical protein